MYQKKEKETKKQITYQKNKETKKQINFEKYKLFEIPFWRVKFENEKSIFIEIDNGEGTFINKKYCYKSKKYEYKQVFLIKIFEEMFYELRDNNDWEELHNTISGRKMYEKIEDLDLNEKY